MTRLSSDEWFAVLEIGVESGMLDQADLCSFSQSCKSALFVANEDKLWDNLLFKKYGIVNHTDSPSKVVYQRNHSLEHKIKNLEGFALEVEKRLYDFKLAIKYLDELRFNTWYTYEQKKWRKAIVDRCPLNRNQIPAATKGLDSLLHRLRALTDATKKEYIRILKSASSKTQWISFGYESKISQPVSWLLRYTLLNLVVYDLIFVSSSWRKVYIVICLNKKYGNMIWSLFLL